MKKLILVVVSMLCMVLCFACLDVSPTSTSESNAESVVTHTYVKHEAVTPDCENAGNEEYYTCSDCDEIFDADKNVIAEIPVIAATGHSYKLNEEVEGNCITKGAESHYECTICDKLFDLLKNEIESVEGDYDLTNHAGEAHIAITSNPVKLTYTVGEAFDPTGLAVAYKCSECAGEMLDNSRLIFEYQTAGATAFAAGDTKVIVKYEDFTLEIEVTVENQTVEISGVLDSYTTRCANAPVIEAVSNIPSLEIFIDYYDAEGSIVNPEDFVAGNVYTAVIYVEGDEGIDGAEVETTIYVEHMHLWKGDSEDVNKVVCVCGCGDEKDFYLVDNKEFYVDSEDMSIDLSELVYGTSDFSVVAIKQVKNGEQVEITGTNVGSVYTFAASDYETYNPNKLTLLVTFEIDDKECTVSLVSWCVDKVIRSAEDLSVLAYTGGTMTTEGGVAVYGYYVLGCDIDATGFVMDAAKPAFQAAVGFMGTFDGCGYTISNLEVPYGSKGLFGALGFGATVKNVTLDNVTVPVKVSGDSGSYLLAFAIRNATLSNVAIEFSGDSLGFKLAHEIGNSVIDNVSVYTLEGHDATFVINDCEGDFDYTYMPSNTVTFDVAGGSEVAPVIVVSGKPVSKPSDPTKMSGGYDCGFLGWYLGEEKYDFSQAVTEDITLVAKWQDPVYITKAEDLLQLAYTGASSKGDEGAFAMGGTYILANDIDATGLVLSGASPAWQAAIGFCGTFDGQGYTISNLTIPANSHGLFGAIGYGAVIQNVKFENVIQEEDRFVLAYAIRNATLSNITVEFSRASKGFKLAHEINDTVIETVSVAALEGNQAASSFSSCNGEISYNYWSDKIYIRNAEDLLLLAYTGAMSSGDEGSFAITDTYILANDIDATGLVLSGSNPAWQAAIGFCGTFDGQGYTISNLTVPAWSYGLFGAIGIGAEIKDVNFENLVQGEDGVLLAHAIRNATLSNVTVEFSASSTCYKIANEINDSTFVDVTVITRDDMVAAGTIARCEGEIEYEYSVGKILISSAEDLLQLAYTGAASAGDDGAYANNNHYVLTGNIDAAGLVLSGSGPAWQAAIGFCGTFDGKGYTISNLTVPAWSFGLFGAIGIGAEIKDVNFENLVQGEDGVLLAHAIRNATLSNVTVEFSASSTCYKIANEINDSTFVDVTVITRDDMVAAGTIARCEGEIAYEYTVGKIVIRTAEDLLQLAYTGPASAGDEGAYANNNHYVLAGNIDATGLVLSGSGPAWQASIGFCGTFDGQGYTISNLSVPAWSFGLFGAIGIGAEIKDVNFENLVQGEDGVLLAHAIRNATLSNVTVEFSEESTCYKIANEINDSAIVDVTVITRDDMVAAGTIARCEGEITYKYYVGKIVIRTAEDLLQLAYTGPANAGDEGAYANNAHYVLAGNIDATGLVLSGSGPAWQAAIGFRGTFDGQGYAISNLTINDGTHGLFGSIGAGAVIKNVKFENVINKQASEGSITSVFAFAIRQATLSNVTVEFSEESTGFRLANEINDSTIENVNVLTAEGQAAANGFNSCTGEIIYTYFGEEE